jgi:hypothetical protein
MYDKTDDASSSTSGACSTFASTARDRSVDERQLCEFSIGNEPVSARRYWNVLRRPSTSPHSRTHCRRSGQPFVISIGNEPSVDGEEGSATDFEAVDSSDIFDDHQESVSVGSDVLPRANEPHHLGGNPVMQEFGP